VGPLVAEVGQRALDAVDALADRHLGQADENGLGQAGRNVHLDFDGDRVDTKQSEGIELGQHVPEGLRGERMLPRCSPAPAGVQSAIPGAYGESSRRCPLRASTWVGDEPPRSLRFFDRSLSNFPDWIFDRPGRYGS